MVSVTGVFQSRTAAEEGLAVLLPLGIPKDRITILTPQATEKELAAVPTVEAEQPGMGKPSELPLEELWALPVEWVRRER
jgi:hypothetical protein